MPPARTVPSKWEFFTQVDFTQVDVPGSTLTSFWAINDAGVGVGRTDDAAGKQHGFVFDGTDFTTVDVPGRPSP